MEKEKLLLKENQNTNIQMIYEEDEIDLIEIVKTLKEKFKIVLISVLTFLFISMIYVYFFTKPIYEYKILIYVPNYPSLQDNLKKLKVSIQEINYDLNHKSDFYLMKYLNEIIVNDKELKSLKSGNSLLLTLRTYKNSTNIKHIINDRLINLLNTKTKIDKIIYIKRKSLIKSIKENRIRLEELKNIRKKMYTNINLILNSRNIFQIEEAINSLNNLIISQKEVLKSIKPIYILYSTDITDKPVKPKKGVIFSVSIISGLFVGIFLAFLIKWWEENRERLK